MLKKILIVIGCIALLVVGAVGSWFYTNSVRDKEAEQLTSQIATLNSRLDAIGPITTCYTVRETIKPGTKFTQDMIVEESIPEAFVNEDFANLLDIVGQPESGYGYYAKTYIEPGTPITKSLVMSEPIIDSLREMDVTAKRWPIGLTEGDYVDVRLTYPRGEDFVVLSHKRVMEVNEQTLKLYMTEEEQMIYQAALVDTYLGASQGTDLYFIKYVEPGIQAPAIPYYTIPDNIANICLLDPNIVDIAQVTVSRDILKVQQGASNPYDDETQSEEIALIVSGRDRLNSQVNSDYSSWAAEYREEQAQRENDTYYYDDGNSSLITGGVD